jgi:hypothetical protein
MFVELILILKDYLFKEKSPIKWGFFILEMR